MRAMPAEAAWLVFRLGPHVMCASALDVEGIIEPVRPRPVPFSPPYMLGWFDFRGRVAAVVSLRRKFGVQVGEDSASGPYIVARVQGELAAFWVDEVRDVLEKGQAEWQPMPPMPGAAAFDCYAIRDGEVILRTSFERLLRADSVAAFSPVAEAPAAPPVAEPAAPPSEPPPSEPPRAEPLPAEPLPAEPPPRPTPEPAARREPERPKPAPRAPRPPAPREPRPAAPPRPPAKPAPPPAPVERVVHTWRETDAIEIDPAPSPELQPPGRGLRIAIFAAFALAVGAGLLAWQLRPREAPPPAPAAATGTIAPVPGPKPAARILTIEGEKFTLTVDRPAAQPAPPVPTPNPARADGRITHVVARGDTLSHIAHRYLGDAARYPELASSSRIRDPDLIYPGDIVTIDKAPPRR
jgi:chemotaxis signal transduction protein/nucleoid-associated protein YgaU